MSAPLKERLAEIVRQAQIYGYNSALINKGDASANVDHGTSKSETVEALLALIRDTVKGAMPERKPVNEIDLKMRPALYEKEVAWNAALDQIEASLKQAGVL